jgi:hypothetical protein
VNLHPVPKFRISGSIPPLSLHTFLASMGTTSSFCMKCVRNELGEVRVLEISIFKKHILWFEGVYSLGLNLYKYEQAVDPVTVS